MALEALLIIESPYRPILRKPGSKETSDACKQSCGVSAIHSFSGRTMNACEARRS